MTGTRVHRPLDQRRHCKMTQIFTPPNIQLGNRLQITETKN